MQLRSTKHAFAGVEVADLGNADGFTSIQEDTAEGSHQTVAGLPWTTTAVVHEIFRSQC